MISNGATNTLNVNINLRRKPNRQVECVGAIALNQLRNKAIEWNVMKNAYMQ